MLNVSWAKIFRPLVIAAVAGALSVAVLPAPLAQAATLSYRIATLGDSWASGEGMSPYSDTNCDRSRNAWSYQVTLPDTNTVAEDLSSGTASLQFLACQGAETKHLINTTQTIDGSSYAPQIGRMSTGATHVFVSVSGNDLNFGAIAIGCLWASTSDCTGTIEDARNYRVSPALRGLSTSIKNIHDRAPQAQIIVTGYAPLVGTGSWWGSNATLLKAFALEFNGREKTTVNALKLLGIDVDFVDLTSDFNTHGYGDTGNAWILAPSIGARYSLHPNSIGVHQISLLVSKVVEKPLTGSCSGNVASGMTGNCVREVQGHLASWGSNLTIDGSFGAKTKAAVVAFQKAHSLTADGIVGPKTKALLWRF